MPIYEYACSACGREIEELVRQSSPAPGWPLCADAIEDKNPGRRQVAG